MSLCIALTDIITLTLRHTHYAYVTCATKNAQDAKDLTVLPGLGAIDKLAAITVLVSVIITVPMLIVIVSSHHLII
jgi:hypothetical protein